MSEEQLAVSQEQENGGAELQAGQQEEEAGKEMDVAQKDEKDLGLNKYRQFNPELKFDDLKFGLAGAFAVSFWDAACDYGAQTVQMYGKAGLHLVAEQGQFAKKKAKDAAKAVSDGVRNLKNNKKAQNLGEAAQTKAEGEKKKGASAKKAKDSQKDVSDAKAKKKGLKKTIKLARNPKGMQGKRFRVAKKDRSKVAAAAARKRQAGKSA